MGRSFDGLRAKPEREPALDDLELARLLATDEGEAIIRLLKKRLDVVVAADAPVAIHIDANAKRAMLRMMESLYAEGRGIDFDAARKRLWNYPDPGRRKPAGSTVAEPGGKRSGG